MKKFLVILALALCGSAAFAQTVPAPKYSEIKGNYSVKNYVKSDVDPYQVFWIGLGSFAVPGSGQLIMRETKRGWMFLGGSMVIDMAASIAGTNQIMKSVQKVGDSYQVVDQNALKTGHTVIAVAALAQVGLAIWSCIDAVNVAKVKNMYYQDLAGKKHSVSTDLHPSVNYAYTGEGLKAAPGMTFSVQF